MQLTITRPAAAPAFPRIAQLLAGWQAARARRADDRLIQREADRLSRLAPHLLDDIGLAHLSRPPRQDRWYLAFTRAPRA